MENEVWTVQSCRAWTEDYLRKKGEERPQLAAEWLLCAACGFSSRTDLYMHYNKVMTPAELETMRHAVRRRANGEPLQYITGETQFRMINVMCAPGVLIPRPETEILVDEVLKYLEEEVLVAKERKQLEWNGATKQARLQEQSEEPVYEEDEDMIAAAQHGDDAVFGAAAYEAERAEEEAAEQEQEEPEAQEPARAKILEVGCGTGCISLSLAYERHGRVSCLGTDIEPRAVELATQNRDALKLTEEDCRFIRTNLVSAVPRSEWGSFDVLVSNPPYIPSKVMGELPGEVVNYEPDLALDGGEDGLDIYRRLLKAAPYMLKPGGLFACELFEGACGQAAQLCQEAGLTDIDIVQDLTGRPRIVRAIKPLDMQVAPL